MLPCIVNSGSQPYRVPRTLHFRHRDEKPVTATPLDPTLTNCDARNPFRMRIYENCRVSSPAPFIFVSPPTFSRKKPFCKSIIFCALRTLPSSVSRNSFACHSYENCRACINNSHSGTLRPLIAPLTPSPSLSPDHRSQVTFPLVAALLPGCYDLVFHDPR